MINNPRVILTPPQSSESQKSPVRVGLTMLVQCILDYPNIDYPNLDYPNGFLNISVFVFKNYKSFFPNLIFLFDLCYDWMNLHCFTTEEV